MQPIEPTLNEESVTHIFKLKDHCVCADAAHCGSLWGREWEEATKLGYFILRPPHTHNFPHFLDEMAHYDTRLLGKVPNSHPEPTQYSELCCLFLALLNSNEFPNNNGDIVLRMRIECIFLFFPVFFFVVVGTEL
jgi:hypothetical protein